MKNLMFSAVAAALFTTTSLFTSCESPAQKVDSAQNKVADAKDKVADAKVELTEAQKTANAEMQKAADAEAWKLYKIEAEASVKINDVRIAELKAEMKKLGKKADATYKENVNILEKKNEAMKNRIKDYDKSPSEWEAFKRELSHDMSELGQALKDFTVNNKK